MNPSNPPPVGWRAFVQRRAVSWGDSDPAGIVFTGRFPVFVLEAIEIFARERLAIDWYGLTVDERIGTPFVNFTIDFHHPVTPRDSIDIEVTVARVGTTSLTFAARGRHTTRGTLCFEAAATCVFVDATTMSKIAIPPRFHAALAAEAAAAVGARA